MKAMTNPIRVAALTAALVAGPMWGQTQTVPTTGGPQSGSPGSEIPNRSVPGNTAASNSSLQQDKNGDMGLNLGWLGLLGLAGLLGLRRGSAGVETKHHHNYEHTPQASRG